MINLEELLLMMVVVCTWLIQVELISLERNGNILRLLMVWMLRTLILCTWLSILLTKRRMRN